jgi:hypothetical protein
VKVTLTWCVLIDWTDTIGGSDSALVLTCVSPSLLALLPDPPPPQEVRIKMSKEIKIDFVTRRIGLFINITFLLFARIMMSNQDSMKNPSLY